MQSSAFNYLTKISPLLMKVWKGAKVLVTTKSFYARCWPVVSILSGSKRATQFFDGSNASDKIIFSLRISGKADKLSAL